jgi:peptidyl-prolyl cis-trans isomerase B (cyclophilin B)
VATNQMRREAAKRKLERQQERRVQQSKRKRTVAVITSAAVVVVVLVGVVLLSTLGGGEPEQNTEAAAAPAAGAPGSCAYTPSGEPAKPVEAPPTEDVSAEGTVPVTLQTSAGTVPLTLDRAAAPCTVNSFVSLARQGYFDATTCHRLTTTEGLKVLQCGDPTGSGSGGPGYQFADEASPDSTYPRGTLAMANAGPDTNGSQFFMVYGDSQLPPDYTVFGSIAPEGLQVLDQIAAGGLTEARRPGDGAPATPVTVETATVR